MAEPADQPARQYNLTCLAPILDRSDPNAPNDLKQAFLFGPWHYPVERADLVADDRLGLQIVLTPEHLHAILVERGTGLVF